MIKTLDHLLVIIHHPRALKKPDTHLIDVQLSCSSSRSIPLPKLVQMQQGGGAARLVDLTSS